MTLKLIVCSLLLHLRSRASSFSATPKPTRAKVDFPPLGSGSDASAHHLLQLPSVVRSSSGDDNDNWSSAKRSLRNPECCVVAVPGLERHVSALRRCFCGDDAPADLDLRMRVRCGKNENTDAVEEENAAYDDCARVYDAVMEPSSTAKGAIDDNFGRRKINDRSPREIDYPNRNDGESPNNIAVDDADAERTNCILALEELARGIASLADGPLEGTCTDVHLRVACASDYRAIDPMWHTDKCPLRGYVTLTGPGTEYVERTCLPWEYAALRTGGAGVLSKEVRARSLRVAEEGKFIVMKGDLHEAPLPDDVPPQSPADAMLRKVWDRSSACVHRSPPSVSTERGEGSRRRVILSLDLADGKDDQEWYEVSRKRGWRSGMTQRKSRLVS